jgi:hypothetical protein
VLREPQVLREQQVHREPPEQQVRLVLMEPLGAVELMFRQTVVETMVTSFSRQIQIKYGKGLAARGVRLRI